jgi:TolB-like protein/tetratricopeptide (TPR) repeat protein
LVDFGLAKPVAAVSAEPGALTTRAALTQPGAVAGTPQYMSPEQLQGGPVDAQSDLFAAGAVLYEMLTGRPAFNGRTVPELFHAIVYEPPATLTGPAAILHPTVLRALAKTPQDRFQNAQAMASQLRTLQQASPTQTRASARGPSRLIVLPFYQLREDEETSFLCFSLPDAISSSLTGLGSLVVRSSRVASRYSGPSIDLRAIAQETGVDAVMTGTLLRAGDQIHASAQLLEAPGGTVVWTHSTRVRLDDIFEFQDGVVKAIVESLALPLTDRERTEIGRDVPASARAYEFYLRANQLSNRIRDLSLAREMYLRCLDEDPKFAPAWARLARCYRVLAKYGADPKANMNRAEEAFERAFAANPHLATAHCLYAQHETEHGRGEKGITRLLDGVQRNPNDPELLAGLVHVCRYVGLLDASLTAHELAHRIDPNVRTTVINTHFAMGNFQLALDASVGDAGFIEAMLLEALGRRQEALASLRRSEEQDLPPLLRRITEMLKFFLADDRDRASESLRELNLQAVDPEGFFYRARLLARLGETAAAAGALERAVAGGFWCVPALLQDNYLEPVRITARFRELVLEAKSQAARAATAFEQANGAQLLSVRDRSTGR